MVHKQDISCPHCQSNDLKKHGKSRNGTQRWRCNVCSRGFQLMYTYNGHRPGIKAQIDAQILNSSGVRDTARILKINPGTVCDHLKKKRQPK
jgi:transposase-like protein